MKLKQRILKTAVLALTVCGAYAFSAQSSFRYLADESDPNSCTSITVGCDQIPSNLCRVMTTEGPKQVWNNISCSIPVYHSSPVVLPEG